jgi:hypothetical protein
MTGDHSFQQPGVTPPTLLCSDSRLGKVDLGFMKPFGSERLETQCPDPAWVQSSLRYRPVSWAHLGSAGNTLAAGCGACLGGVGE